MGVDPFLYGFMLDYAREEAVLVHILYLYKKMRLLNSFALGTNILNIVRYFIWIYCFKVAQNSSCMASS